MENGRANHSREEHSSRDEMMLKKYQRSPLTFAEVIALCTHTNTLSERNLWAAGSRCNGLRPFLSLEHGNPIFCTGDPQLSPQKRPMVITSKPANGATFVDKVFYSFVRDQASRFCFL
ncbi:MAG: hypothetical protein DMG13_32205 [Acidobacteria bacterium]|nr:MAG: hypothetical protein DMG13_32205 [Acidobacteriota bacterium]